MDLEKPATAIRKKDGMKTVGRSSSEGSSYRKGMYLAFIDEAFAQRQKVSGLLSVAANGRAAWGARARLSRF
jgi:hypothetical protein